MTVSQPPESVLPELRPMWWEQGMRARVDAGLFGVFAGMPRLIVEALRISWGADRVRTAIVAVSTLAAGAMATFGLLATQRVLVELGCAASGLVIAAAPTITASRWHGAIVTAVARLGWQAVYVDCADGQLARVPGTSSAAPGKRAGVRSGRSVPTNHRLLRRADPAWRRAGSRADGGVRQC